MSKRTIRETIIWLLLLTTIVLIAVWLVPAGALERGTTAIPPSPAAWDAYFAQSVGGTRYVDRELAEVTDNGDVLIDWDAVDAELKDEHPDPNLLALALVMSAVKTGNWKPLR